MLQSQKIQRIPRTGDAIASGLKPRLVGCAASPGMVGTVTTKAATLHRSIGAHRPDGTYTRGATGRSLGGRCRPATRISYDPDVVATYLAVRVVDDPAQVAVTSAPRPLRGIA